jgi:DNA-directed RNA polymerase specialized sigma24 family protein
VEIASNGVDYASAPKDYSDLFRIYYNYVVALVRGAGIDDSRKEDVASEILLRFYERGFLEKFDPTLVFTYDGRAHKARFKNFLANFVLTYAKGHRDKQNTLTRREVLVLDDGDSDTHNAVRRLGPGSADTHPGHEDEVIEVLQERATVAYLREYLGGIPRRCHGDRCDLVALFDAIVVMVHDTGVIDVKALRRDFNIGATAIHSWLKWLRANIREALTERPTVGAR